MSTTPVNPTTPAAPAQPAREPHVHTVTYCGHTKLIFLWPIIALGYVLWPIAGWGGNSETLGWIYLLSSITVILAVTTDLNRNFGIFWLVLLAFIVTLGRWLADAKGIPILGNIAHWFAGLDVQYNRAFGLCFSIIMSVFFVIGILWAWSNNRYTMTHNEVLHHVWGRGDTSVGRGARVITMLYPDWFEFIICLAGTIIVYDNTGRTQICRSEHVPLLPFRAGRIQKILESLEVTQDDTCAAAGDQAGNDGTDDLH